MPDTLLGDGLLPFPIRINANQYGDYTLLTVVHSTSTPYVEIYRVHRNGTKTVIGTSDGLSKDDSGVAIAYPDGTVRLYVSQADPGQSGTTSKVYFKDFPSAIPPFKPLEIQYQDILYLYDKIQKIQNKLSEAGSI
jgi:hypothetical protein